MRKDILLKIGIAVSLFIILVIVILSTLGFNPKDEKNELTDFSEPTPVKVTRVCNDLICRDEDFNYLYNGEILLKSGIDYKKNDAVYILTSTTIYAKYILNNDDIDDLKSNDLLLNLSLDSNLRISNYQYNYYYVKQSDIKQFEKLFNTKDTDGDYWDLIINPEIFKVDFSSSISFSYNYFDYFRKSEYDNNDEKIIIGLMQSLKYDENSKVKLIELDEFDKEIDVIFDEFLTTEEINHLRRDNLRYEYDMASIFDSYELKENSVKHYFKVILYNNDEEISSITFTINVTSY